MAYQRCANDTIILLKDKYPNNDWNECIIEEEENNFN